jgi:hypothetical protein
MTKSEEYRFDPYTGEKIYKCHNLKYVEEPRIAFSKVTYITEYNPEHLIYMREHKNRMVEIRDKHDKISELYKVYDLEIQRIITFLERFQ